MHDKSGWQKPNYDAWLRRDVWTPEQFIYLICGFDPDSVDREYEGILVPDNSRYLYDLFEEYRTITEMFKQSLALDKFQLDDRIGLNGTATPAVFIEWAVEKLLDLPPPVSEWALEAGLIPTPPTEPRLSSRELQKLQFRERDRQIYRQYQCMKTLDKSDVEISRTMQKDYPVITSETIRRIISQKKSRKSLNPNPLILK